MSKPIVEVKLTIRWSTKKPLEDALAELLKHTSQFRPKDRFRGYLEARFMDVDEPVEKLAPPAPLYSSKTTGARVALSPLRKRKP